MFNEFLAIAIIGGVIYWSILKSHREMQDEISKLKEGQRKIIDGVESIGRDLENKG